MSAASAPRTLNVAMNVRGIDVKMSGVDGYPCLAKRTPLKHRNAKVGVLV